MKSPALVIRYFATKILYSSILSRQNENKNREHFPSFSSLFPRVRTIRKETRCSTHLSRFTTWNYRYDNREWEKPVEMRQNIQQFFKLVYSKLVFLKFAQTKHTKGYDRFFTYDFFITRRRNCKDLFLVNSRNLGHVILKSKYWLIFQYFLSLFAQFFSFFERLNTY